MRIVALARQAVYRCPTVRAFEPEPLDMSFSFRLHQKRTGGFTLVEMLLVVSLIVLLISMLLPSLAMSRKNANVVKCQNVMRRTADANRLYAIDHLNRYIYNTYGGSSYEGTGFTRYWSTDPVFLEYLGMTTPEVSNRWKTNDGTYGGGFNAGCQWPTNADCPEQGKPKYWLQNDHWGHEIGVAYNREQHGKSYGVTSVQNPSGKFQFADGDNWWMGSWGSDYKFYFDNGFVDHGGWGGLLPRHDLGKGAFANVAFYDNHVESVPKEETFYYSSGPDGASADQRNKAKWLLGY